MLKPSWSQRLLPVHLNTKISKLAFVTMANWPESNGTDLPRDHDQGIVTGIAAVVASSARKSVPGRGSGTGQAKVGVGSR